MEPNTEDSKPALTIIHFNDVYDLQPKGKSMGVCNFKAKLDQLKADHPGALVLFSGDALSPSTLTNIKEGWQMVEALNMMGLDCACYGNHEFDFEEEHTLKLAKACNFPWLLANIRYFATGLVIGEGKPYVVKEVGAHRVGIMGIAGDDWVGILNDDYEGIIEYQDCYEVANKLVVQLREEEKCNIVVALTHMRNWADEIFPEKVRGVDIVLGGHDHVVFQKMVEGVPVIKSGTNFNHIGLVQLFPKAHATGRAGVNFNFEWEVQKVPIADKVDPVLEKYVEELMEEYAQYDEVVGHSDVELDTRFTSIRTRETNYGNFFADLIKRYYDTDFAFINAGMVRNDMVIPPGKITYSKVSNIIDSQMIVLRLPGCKIREALEYGVSQYPGFAGNFLLVSGLRFSFDHTKTPRVQEVTVLNKPLELEKQYTVATTSFQGRGGDGFTMLKDGEMIIDEVKGTSMLHCLLKFFKAADAHQEFESIKELARSSSHVSQLSQISQSEQHLPDGLLPTFPHQHLKLARKLSVRMGRIKGLRSRFVLSEDGHKLTSIAPEVDGRVHCLNPVPTH